MRSGILMAVASKLPWRPPGRRLQAQVRRSERERHRNLRVIDRELHDAERLGLAARPPAAGGRPGMEEVREGDADVGAAGRILVVFAVAVVVDPLGVELVEALLALGGVGLAHESRLAVHRDPLAGGILHPHLGDETVAVEVVRSVLVGLVVHVVVPLAGVPLVGHERLPEIPAGRVGVAVGQDEPREVLHRGGAGYQPVGERERPFCGERQDPFEVGHHEDGGHPVGLLARLGADFENGQFDAAGTRRDPVQGRLRGVGLVDGNQRRVDLLRRTIGGRDRWSRRRGRLLGLDGRPAADDGGRQGRQDRTSMKDDAHGTSRAGVATVSR